jgi:hypothetical protein
MTKRNAACATSFISLILHFAETQKTKTIKTSIKTSLNMGECGE